MFSIKDSKSAKLEKALSELEARGAESLVLATLSSGTVSC